MITKEVFGPNPEEMSDFWVNAYRVLRELNPPKRAFEEAHYAASEYGITQREQTLLVIETTFFKYNPPTEEIRKNYLDKYEDMASEVCFMSRITSEGWMYRWGANHQVAQSAAKGGSAGFGYRGLSAEGLLGVMEDNLRLVFFQREHEEILNEHGYFLRGHGSDRKTSPQS